MPQLFFDLDGVLADMREFYFQTFGEHLDRGDPDPPRMWDNIHSRPRFWAELPLMSDALELWDGAKRLHANPIILTAAGKMAGDAAPVQKREWVSRYFGESTPIICCRARDKRLAGKPGDVLVDDWVRYRHLWEEMGGIFILHTSAADSLPKIEAALHGDATDAREDRHGEVRLHV